MKKTTLFVLIALSIASCKKELPNIIKTAIFNCELQYDLNSDIDSIILNLDKSKISQLSEDSLSSLIFKQNFGDKQIKQSESELENLLILNPEYSDYHEIKNMKTRYYNKDSKKYFDNSLFIQKKYHELLLK
jgi:hypothetical protein